MMTSIKTSLPFKKVIIVGAGFSGVAMAYQLRHTLKCDDFVIYDRGAGFGGTWLANTYPGCGVDIPAVFYSLSYAPNPDFSNLFPKQDEVLQYIDRVASRFNLTRHLVGNTEWVGASWQDDTKTWLVKLRDLSTGQEYIHGCNIVISAVGALTNPNLLTVPGTNCFQGDIIHTSRWDHDVSLRDKRVVVIGNGASATQLIPAVAAEVRSITQFIRSTQYFLPGRANNTISPLWQNAFRYVPGLLRLVRLLTFSYLETATPQFSLTETGEKMRKQTSEVSRCYIMDNAPAQYWPLLMPKFEVGCRRRVFDNDNYVRCLKRDNVHLTNDPVVALHERSVLANGFALTQYDTDVHGRGGRSRSKHWKDMGGIEAFNTIGMSEFPNFFYVLGPNSGRGHTSVVYSIESYTGLIARVIKPILEGSALCAEPKLSSEKAYNKRLHDALCKTVFTNSCGSWFIDPQTGKNWAVYPWSSFHMWWTTQVAGLEDWVYELPKMNPRGRNRSFLACLAMSTLVAALSLWWVYSSLYPGTERLWIAVEFPAHPLFCRV
ncbi:hypothetical protein NUU61_002930 [Penicillium alfredii]|uniref:FAD/NAD(P)-binding domain-containing protein n=1 Tax=Penicillium alfredii TaxID=1506179 RepID=A0A9W9KHE5_9EURO|nr:uncharacterized protein NUU61_002930 [Penicillium alfredii]KAJ5105583.1 hypothetical protein NUU61_002930 [Penicillium alfredii]